MGQEEILEVLKKHPEGLTTKQIAEELNQHYNGVSYQLIRLMTKKEIYRTLFKGKNNSPTFLYFLKGDFEDV